MAKKPKQDLSQQEVPNVNSTVLLTQQLNKLNIKWGALKLMVQETEETLNNVISIALQSLNDANIKIKELEEKIKDKEGK